MRGGVLAVMFVLAAPAQAGVVLAACPVTQGPASLSCSPDQIEDAVKESAERGEAAFKQNQFEEAANLWLAGAQLDPTHPAVAALQSNAGIALREAGIAAFSRASSPAAVAQREAARQLIRRSLDAWIAARAGARASEDGQANRTAFIGGLETLRVLDQMNALQGLAAGDVRTALMDMAQDWLAAGPDAPAVAALGPSIVALGAESRTSNWDEMADVLLKIAPGQPDVTLVYAIYASESEDAALRARARSATEAALATPGLDARMRTELRSFLAMLD
jgi:hypothetical protein